MTPKYSSSIEFRARRLASKLNHQQLIEHAEYLEREGARAAVVFWRAAEIVEENRALESSLTLSEVMGDAVYQLRPSGPLPSDGIGLEL